jgi:integrase
MEGVHGRMADGRGGRQARGAGRVTAASAAASPEFLDAAAGSYRPARLAELWQAMPADMQAGRFTIATFPERYRGAFTEAGDRRAGLDLSPLPEVMRRELAWCVFRIAERGGVVCAGAMTALTRRLAEVSADLGPQAPASLLAWPASQWLHQIALAVARRSGALPAPGTMRHVRQSLCRCYRQLWAGYDTRPWWQREYWDPAEDTRIPLRPHEPLGTKTVYFRRIGTGWLRQAAQWHFKTGLETGTLSWSTVHVRAGALAVFSDFLAAREPVPPWLAGDPGAVRALMLDFLGHVRALRVERNGPTKGRPVSGARACSVLGAVEEFYSFMHDNKDAAASALAEPGWARLGPEHARFYRRGEKPRPPRYREDDRDVIGDEALAAIMAGTGILGDPPAEGGFGDEQAMRILMLLARTGRRMNEILMLDRDPLTAVPGTPAGAAGPGAFTARLRYQQTKIDGAPDTILVDAEIVAIIRAQQEWASGHFTARGAPGKIPKYLFLAARMNRNGDRPYSMAQLNEMLTRLVTRLGVRDAAGRQVDFQRTHRFRHTRATSLLNAGVPIHVVQRYLGHLSPAMTMHYAQTLAETAEAEFLRYRKVTADARDLDTSPRDLYDMLQLDKRTDRILPNGWCLLPPRQSCDRGNACLTCDKFATDATFLPEIRAQKDRTITLIDSRQAAFTARTGTPMTPGNVWLDGRQREAAALDAIITTLDALPGNAVRGAGVPARTSAVIARQDGRNAR